MILSGIVSVLLGFIVFLPHSTANSPMDPFHLSSLKTDLVHINKDSILLLRKARFLGMPGTNGAAPDEKELQILEQKIFQMKPRIEALLQQEDSTQNYAQNQLLKKEKENLLLLFFEQTASLFSIRVALDQPHDSLWIRNFNLLIPRKFYQKSQLPQVFRIENLDGVAARSVSGQDGRESQVFRIENLMKLSSEQADHVHVNLSESFLQGLELGELVVNPTQEGYFSALQFFLTDQLLRLLDKVDNYYLSSYVPLSLNQLNLIKKIKNKDRLSQIYKEEQEIQKELQFQIALLNSIPKMVPLFHQFVTEEWAKGLAEIVFPDPDLRESAFTQLFDIFKEAETEKTLEALQEFFSENSFPQKVYFDGEIQKELSQGVSRAKVNTQLNKLLVLQAVEILKLTSEQHQKAVEWILSREERYQKELSKELLQAWLNELKTTPEKKIHELERENLTTALVQTASLVHQIEREIYPETEIDLNVLFLFFQEEIQKRNLRTFSENILKELLETKNFGDAYDTYVKNLKKIGLPVNTQEGQERINLKQVRQVLDQKNFEVHLPSAPDIVNVQFQQNIRNKISGGRKKDVLDLLWMGELFGFFAQPFNLNPTVQQILVNKEDQKKYFSIYKTQLLGLYPILELLVEVKDIRNCWGKVKLPLYQALANAWILRSYSGDDDLPKVEELTTGWIQQALQQVKAKILENLKTVDEAKSTEDLKKIAFSAVTTDHLLEKFPEFDRVLKKQIESGLFPNGTDHFMHHYVGESIFYSCAPILFGLLLPKWITGGTRWILRSQVGHVVPNVIRMPLQTSLRFIHSRSAFLLRRSLPRSAFYRGVMKAVMVPIVVDTGYQLYRFQEEFSKWRQVSNFYYHAPTYEDSFFKPHELNEETTLFWWSAGSLGLRLSLDTYFLWYPMAVSPFLKNFGQKITLSKAERELLKKILENGAVREN